MKTIKRGDQVVDEKTYHLKQGEKMPLGLTNWWVMIDSILRSHFKHSSKLYNFTSKTNFFIIIF